MLIIQEILGYFLIGIIGMVILSVCYLPIYFILRKRIPLSRQIVYFLLGVCVLVICTATFLEWIIACVLDGRTVIAAERSLNLIPFQFITETWAMEARKQITQTIANVVMFRPYFIGRSADIDDIMLNTLGGILGYLVFYVFSKMFKDKKLWKKLNGIAL